MNDVRDRIGTAVAGEFFVAAELARRGWIATLTAKNTPAVEVLAAQPGRDLHAAIQVKTRSAAYPYAHRVGRITLAGDRDFVILVDLRTVDDPPAYWVIPASVAAGLVTNEQIRTADIEEFAGRWDLLDS
jgi:hypothetical protein